VFPHDPILKEIGNAKKFFGRMRTKTLSAKFEKEIKEKKRKYEDSDYQLALQLFQQERGRPTRETRFD
jgi:hypothetical protein